MIRNLIFEGGGVKGIAYGGALEELEKLNIMAGIKRVAGTSAGAITAVLLAVGYESKEVSKIVAETSFNGFADDSFGFIRDAGRLMTEYGWHKGDFFTEWIGQLIERKKGKSGFTFQELSESENSLELFLTATNLSKQRVQVFSHEHTPEVAIKEAARMSMGIPLYFQCVRFNGDIMVDGGVAYNYPINIFDDKKYLAEGKGYAFNQESLGFRLDSKKEIDFNQSWANTPKDIEDFFDFTMALIEFLNSMANKKHLQKDDWDRTVFIDTLGIGAIDFDLSLKQIGSLIRSGQKGVREYFNPESPNQ